LPAQTIYWHLFRPFIETKSYCTSTSCNNNYFNCRISTITTLSIFNHQSNYHYNFHYDQHQSPLWITLASITNSTTTDYHSNCITTTTATKSPRLPPQITTLTAIAAICGNYHFRPILLKLLLWYLLGFVIASGPLLGLRRAKPNPFVLSTLCKPI
jgi:hypothetical protein